MGRKTLPPDRKQSSLGALFSLPYFPSTFGGIAWGLILLAVIILLDGCSSSSPRFKRSSSTSLSSASTQPRFATKVRREEIAEDDKKVNIEEVKDRYSNRATSRADRQIPIDRKKVMTEVLKLIGTPYAYGNSSSEGMDCSAFTAHIYQNAIGRQLPRSTTDQYNDGESLGNDGLRFGDLLFFNTTGESPSHVGIFIGDDLFAHASVSWGVTISSLQSSYYKKRYIGGRRIVQ